MFSDKLKEEWIFYTHGRLKSFAFNRCRVSVYEMRALGFAKVTKE